MEHNLGQMTSIKTWGIASLGAYIAACVTVHPSAMVEYSMPSLEKSTIIFGHAATLGKESFDQVEDENLTFPWESETQLRAPPLAHAGPWSMILRDATSPVLYCSILSCRLLYSSFCVRLMLGATEDMMKGLTIAALHTLARSLNTSFCQEIECLESAELASSDRTRIVEMINSIVRLRSVSETETPSVHRLLEYCQIPECSSPLFYTSNIYRARCSMGHIWSMFLNHAFMPRLTRTDRCALSFLAIQEPGISKFCDTCDREYLNEELLLQEDIEVMAVLDATTNRDEVVESGELHSIESGGSLSEDKGDSLIRAMFRSYGVCIFCDGKFIG